VVSRADKAVPEGQRVGHLPRSDHHLTLAGDIPARPERRTHRCLADDVGVLRGDTVYVERYEHMTTRVADPPC